MLRCALDEKGSVVAWNLRRLRVRRGLSQEKLALDARIRSPYVGGLERREENPTVDLLDKLARTLKTAVVVVVVARPRYLCRFDQGRRGKERKKQCKIAHVGPPDSFDSRRNAVRFPILVGLAKDSVF